MEIENSVPGKMTRKRLILTLSVLLFAAVIFTVLFYTYALDISQTIKAETEEAIVDTTSLKKPVVYLGVISRYPPNIIYRGYQPLLDYLTSQSDYRFELKLSDDYNQAVKMLIKKEVTAAFLGSYVYVKAHKDYGVIPILKPLNENFEPFSRSVLFANSSSDIYNIIDLKNKKLALPSSESFSSNWILKYELKKYDIDPGVIEVTNFPHHQSVIHNVSKGVYQAGVSREYLVKKVTDGSIRIILHSEPFPTSPLVAASEYNSAIIDQIKSILLKINGSNPKREIITKGWDNEFIHGFVEAKDEDYDFIRTIGN